VHPFPISRPSPARAGASAPEIVAAIPARYGSTRLPGKPLLAIAGRPMIEHVYRRVASARGLARIVVLTDDERIARAVAAFGGDCELTPAACASGTDRIAHAARGWPGTAAVINVQGDEPLIDPEAVSAIAEHLAAHPEDPMVTLAAPMTGPATAPMTGPLGEAPEADPAELAAALANPNVVKVVVGLDGRALYFSRAAIPYARQTVGAPGTSGAAKASAARETSGAAENVRAVPLRHIGIYGYQRATLLRLAELAPSPLERSEGLEQLRALEHGVSIRVLLTAPGLPGSPAVDTREDLERVERLLAQGAGLLAAAGSTG
jgi:3-deoxy-manno-octulosonate cytidylyltransferase (CMP-KDO synthetase)